MKKALLATLIGAAFAGSAAADVYDFTYGDGDISFYGFQKKETIDVAIFLPGSAFDGMNVKAVSVPVYASKGIEGYSDVKVWLTSELTLESKKNAPNIASYEAALEYSAGDEIAYLNFSLPQEYTVTADGVYVGYSVTIDKLDGSTRYPVAFTGGGAPGSYYLHSTKSVVNWTDLAASDRRSSAMTVVVESDNLPAQNVAVSSAPEKVYMALNEPTTINVDLSSTASETVNSVDFDITLGGKTTTSHYDLPLAVPAGILKLFTASVEIPAQDELGEGVAQIKVSKVNGKENTSLNATAGVNVSVLKVVPKHLALMEEFTSTGCPWCTRGFAALEYMKRVYPEYVCVSYHTNYGNSDPMRVTDSFPCTVSGYPNAALDRNLVDLDPYYGTQLYDLDVPIVGDIQNINSQLTPWNIEVSHTWDGENTLTANVEIFNIDGFENGSYKIGYLLVSDGLSGEGSAWTQGNNYASYAPTFVPELNAFCKGGIYGKSSVSGLVFNDVVVSVEGYKGVAGSVPEKLDAEETVAHSKSWNLENIKSDLIPDKNKLRIVAFVLDNNGHVLNAAKQDVNDYNGASVEKIGVNDNAPIEFYNLNGVKVDNPQGGIFIRRQGGKAEKVVIK